MADRTQKNKGRRDSVLVIGLGRFGAALAVTLDRLGREVLGIENDNRTIQHWTGRLPLIEADATNPDALEQAGVRDFQVAVVGVGTSLEASVLITGNLVDMGTPEIWAKATSPEHARILRRIGAHHVISPEADAGSRVAHLVSGSMLDYIEVEDGFTIVKILAPPDLVGMTISQARVEERYGVTILGVKSPALEFRSAAPELRIEANDLLIVSGLSARLEKFAAHSN